ncbi:UNVERIFIED_CONTAM: LINE-1 retrotransposable element O protein [Sesamum latifolium]|uniref:LINE-1 retrotransposable element O protein n=1 Tax=Sesamum latifolium TaxID=2727402 RepID=A0AAW2XPF8_9LAMI
MEGIKGKIFGMANFKSPGSDGFPHSFYKQYWHIVGKQVIEAILHFFSSENIVQAINHTYISLIPKSSKADSVDQFRPISLCNTTYKVISKILADRIKPHLEKIISPFQMVFVQGRNISENSIITQEIMHYLHGKKGKKGLMAIKIDLSKVYDRVEWPFLLKLLESVGFNEVFVNWISKCICTTSYSLLINGTAFDFFRPSRGIRQGDPLSPTSLLSTPNFFPEYYSRRNPWAISRELKARAQVFNELLKKLFNKLSLWKAKNLSRAGKLVLTKNVAQSIPVYHMFTFLLPKGICSKMDKMVRRFWWQSKETEENKNFLAFKSWTSICQLKNKGGLGIRKFQDFNEALLPKLSWNILQKSDKIWVKILSAKYLKNGAAFLSILQVQRSSWIWQDAVKCRDLIKMGRISRGEDN